MSLSDSGEPVQINIKPDSLAGNEHTRVETVTVPVATSTPVNMPTDSRSPLSGDLDNSKGLIATSVSSGSTRYSSGVQYPAVLEGTKKNIPAQISSSGSIICGKVPPPVPPRGNTSHKKHALPEGDN
ncbi:hypothetical protein QAD02_021907 [Eretmocerus hayati]|uniref:Uncharacterized protein n=1 Tax=Eretmocerus hayati TaxID=131215 RepID=A0ACC2PSZ5_9HYME|nr:hypothetical protein QAD02_021907 [Eretmocerus hayati]